MGKSPDHEASESFHVPSQDEIRAACAEIQEGWSPADRNRRAGSGGSQPAGTQIIPERTFGMGPGA